jgi:hypothetical protein
LIEQAIFTSAETDRLSGYQVVAASPGVCDEDRQALAVWGPSHGSLIDSSPEGVSFNFHPLPSGAYCVSRTTDAGAEYSGRGRKVYTQCLVVPADELARFANNPFAVLRAALAGGTLEVERGVPRRLDPLQLLGHSAAVDASLLVRLGNRPGPQWLATLVQAALACPALALAASPEPEHLIAGLLNCLPPECRTQFSFSTGLHASPQRPFRIVAMPNDRAEWRQVERRCRATVLDLSQAPPVDFSPIDGWARLIEHVLRAGRIAFLAAQFSKRRFELAPSDLPALGLQLLEEFDGTALPAKQGEQEQPKPRSPAPPAPGDWLDGLQRAHAAHRRFRGSAILAAPATSGEAGPSVPARTNHAEVQQELERLDDLVFAAVDGNADALAQLRQEWPKLHDELGEALLAESREQYLRRALSIWQGSVEPNGLRDPSRASHALEVLCILFDEV